MLNQQNIELIYDAVDGYASILYEAVKTPYLQGMAEACAAILAGSVGPEVPEASRREAARHLKPVLQMEFQKEEVRKALQLCILKGFKHTRRSNADITPDTIGIFAGFLLDKLFPGLTPLDILDPLVGTGNLLVAAANQLERPTKLIGIELDFTSYKLAETMFLMTEHGDDVYCQDTLSFTGVAADAILTDFPASFVTDEGTYFPYEVIKHHRQNLKPDGYLLGVVPNDFFTIPGADVFRGVIGGAWNVLGFVKLPDSLFKGGGKSILILQNAAGGTKPPAKVLLADIPSFEDEEAAARAIQGINLWFREQSR